MNCYLLLTSTFSFGLILLLILRYEGGARLLAVGVILLFAFAGYMAKTRRLHRMDDPRPLPEIRRAPDDPGAEHCAVIYLAHGEPETYNPIG